MWKSDFIFTFLGSLIRNYFQIIRKTLQDVIPKSIVCAMVEFVQVLFKINWPKKAITATVAR